MKALTSSGKDLLKSDEKLTTNRDIIEQYLIAGGEGVELTEVQEKLLERWVFADEVIRGNVGKLKREGIVNLIKNKFGVNRSTAYRDICDAEYVFSSSAPLNKKYRIQLRIEFLENQIRIAAGDKDHMSVAQLEKVLQKYYEKYPDTNVKQSPRVFNFIVTGSAVRDSVMPIDEAEAKIESVLKNLEAMEVEDIEEEIENENEGVDGG